MKDELTGSVRERLDAVIHGGTDAQIPELVKAVLIDSMQCGTLAVPPAFRQPIEGTYARRLLHRDPQGRDARLLPSIEVSQTVLNSHIHALLSTRI